MKTIIKKIFRKLYHFVFNEEKHFSGIRYWKKRAKAYGRRSVFNLRHPEEELEAVTQRQKNILFPILEQQLRGDEKLVLDFGCGPGRFTPDLAGIVHGKAIGVDPVEHLLNIAPRFPNVEYRLMKEAEIPVENDFVDVVWICIVLGGIVDEKVLQHSTAEIDRVLKKNGLVFLVENTSNQPDTLHWKYRPVEMYRHLFGFVNLKHISNYFDLGERLSIMAGRKNVSPDKIL
ncbi:MAG: methyltransferase domain-containing protein [Candidatus Aminicenantes bacterium]|nr:methyltransferase domain-containing protein [Candidatus Aminicenantes bacterium]NIM78858.1 methyltransferase domain-containing protein [Candidatus Aminicenantes bacterium]NIN18114.1 methyltransferase domain-containing protein [Candidatus Aminicenantes bacterium]NIN42013.1 methyltransferase domain-containing protein [Candidatus Aminicenantes bacterium]NIN84769.1 methyltransferase domain-containing protein [Candidatus Aminicenantes bacterium]